VPDRGKVRRERRDLIPLILGKQRRLFPEKLIVIVTDLTLGPQRLLLPLLKGSGYQAVLRFGGPATSFGVLGLVPGCSVDVLLPKGLVHFVRGIR
jgi:hypothetical protein